MFSRAAIALQSSILNPVSSPFSFITKGAIGYTPTCNSVGWDCASAGTNQKAIIDIAARHDVPNRLPPNIRVTRFEQGANDAFVSSTEHLLAHAAIVRQSCAGKIFGNCFDAMR